MKQIIIAPFAQTLSSGKENPKNYPYWEDLLSKLSESYRIVQISVAGQKKLPFVHDVMYNLKLKEIVKLIDESLTWISVDSFLQHLVNASCNKKPGIVLWSLSNPLIFGYPYNLNILKDVRYLRPFQFSTWNEAVYNIEAYHTADEVFRKIEKYLSVIESRNA